MILPDWNSVESVRRAHSVLEGVALVFFALLVVFDLLAHLSEHKAKDAARLLERVGLCCFAIAVLGEIVAFRYGQRNDFLSGRENAAQRDRIATLNNVTEKLRIDAEGAKAAQQLVEIELARQQQRAASAELTLLELQRRMADRTISQESRDAMIASLQTRSPGKIRVESLLSEGQEALRYAKAIASVFREAHWQVTEPEGRGSFRAPIRGVFLVCSADVDADCEFIAGVLLTGKLASPKVETSMETRRGSGVLEVWVAGK